MALALIITATLVSKGQPQSTAPDADNSIYVGILDDAREDLDGEKTDLVQRRLIMPAFEKHDAEWQAVKHFLPNSVKWTVAFDGRNWKLATTSCSTVA